MAAVRERTWREWAASVGACIAAVSVLAVLWGALLLTVTSGGHGDTIVATVVSEEGTRRAGALSFPQASPVASP